MIITLMELSHPRIIDVRMIYQLLVEFFFFFFTFSLSRSPRGRRRLRQTRGKGARATYQSPKPTRGALLRSRSSTRSAHFLPVRRTRSRRSVRPTLRTLTTTLSSFRVSERREDLFSFVFTLPGVKWRKCF